MKSMILATLLLIAFNAKADWTDANLSEPGIGCLALGGANYLSAQGDATQNFAMGCLIGGVAGYLLDSYYTNKVSDRYEQKLDIYKKQMQDVVVNQAINSSQGINDYGIVIKEEVVPGKQLPDGSIQLPTMRIKAELPGRDIVIGD